MRRSTISERALVLAPRGRDAALAATILHEAGLSADCCASLPGLIDALNRGAAFVVVTEEALLTADLSPLSAWLREQEEWSDLPFVLLTNRGGGLERNPAAHRFLDLLGNVTFLERPFHPTTLVSLARSALRGRRRQYEARARLQALQQGEERYRTLFENIDSAFCVVEVIFDDEGRPIDHRFVEINPAFEQQTGLKNALGRRAKELLPDHEQHWFDIYGRLVREGGSIRFENGSDALGKWFDVHALRVGKAEQRRVAIVFNDITERKKAEDRLHELNETLEKRVADALAERKLMADIVETTDSFVNVLDLDFRWLAINRAGADEFERVFGKRPRIGDSLLDLLADQPDQLAIAKAVWSRALAGEEFIDVAEFGDPDRVRGAYEMKFNTLRNERGERIGAFQVVTDVTERLRNQARLAEAEDQLRHSQKMEAVGQLTGGVAHDFNNLLTIIKSSTDLLRRKPGVADEQRRRYIDAISDTVDRAARLTGQLLAFARRQSLKPEAFDAVARVAAVTDMLRTVVGSRVRIVAQTDPGPCVVVADVSQFETALVNMAMNARDAMSGEGTLTVTVRGLTNLPPLRGHAGGAGPFVALSIGDTGVGIPPDRLSQIFEPFFTTKEVGKGTGLGLSQVYGFAKQSGGDVAVESEVGKGTTFTLYLPRAEVVTQEQEIRPIEASRSPAEGRGRRVLVVEDNFEVGQFSTQLLEDLGYVTTWAPNAGDALKLLDEVQDFDVVFSDVVMPGMSGLELGEEIRRRYPDLPVVLTSGYSHVLAEEGRHGFELLRKPYAMEDLSKVLHRVTHSRAAEKRSERTG